MEQCAQPEKLAQIVSMINKDDRNIEILGNDIHHFFKEQKQTEEMKEERDQCVKLIKNYLYSDSIKNQLDRDVWIRQIAVFGSFPTHCASRNSDLDLCVCLEYQTSSKPPPVTVLQAIFRDLKYRKKARLSEYFGDRKITDIVLISTARVPIVKFRLNGIQIDLSASFSKLPPRTCVATKLINAYCQLDDRFAVLVIFLKTWLKSEADPQDHLRDFPNSYSLTLMLIHVLQWYKILPHLYKEHKGMFNPAHASWESVEDHCEFEHPLNKNTIVKHRKQYSKDLTVVQLLYLFASHYSDDKTMHQFCFNMKTGQLDPRKSKDSPLTIIDTYDERNPARSARGIYDLRTALKYMMELLRSPQEKIFSRLIRFTTEKLYVSPPLHMHQRGLMSIPTPPFLVQQGPYQNGIKHPARSNTAVQNFNYFGYYQSPMNNFLDQRYFTPPSMNYQLNYCGWPPLKPDHANRHSGD